VIVLLKRKKKDLLILCHHVFYFLFILFILINCLIFFSVATASVCSDDTVELDHLSPMTPLTVTTTPQRSKPPLERKEHILTPISNGPTPVRVRVS
jgi:hypothetical protein